MEPEQYGPGERYAEQEGDLREAEGAALRSRAESGALPVVGVCILFLSKRLHATGPRPPRAALLGRTRLPQRTGRLDSLSASNIEQDGDHEEGQAGRPVGRWVD